MNHGKCPSCEHILQGVHIEAMSLKQELGGQSLNGVSYLCPHCKTILGVQVDPIAVQSDTVNDLKKVVSGLKR